MILQILEVTLLGGAIGLSSATLGVGGGILIVPILPLLVPMPQQAVIATSLVSILIVVSLNTFGFHRQKLVDWSVAISIGISASLMAYLGALYTLTLPQNILKLILGLSLTILAIFLTSNKGLITVEAFSSKGQKLFSVLLGFMSGLISGLTGIGAGAVLSSILLKLKLVAHQKVAPTANAIMVFTTTLAIIPFLRAKMSMEGGDLLEGFEYHWPIVLSLSGVIVAKWARGHQEKLPEAARKKILATILLILGVKELFYFF